MKLTAFCDGSGNLATGPACIGVAVFAGPELLVEVSEYVGPGTNNVAELRAIRRAMHLLEMLGTVDAPARLVSDSQYALTMIFNDWDPNANEALVRACRAQYRSFAALELVHVNRDAGIFGNVLADWLAGEARARWLAKEGLSPRKRKARPEPKEAEHGKG